MAERITITVAAGGDDADARAFGAALRDILDILDSLSKEKTVWRIVAMEKKSPPTITLESRRGGIGGKLTSGIKRIQQEVANPFPVRAMRAVRRVGWRLRERQLDSLTIKSEPSEGGKSEVATLRPSDQIYDHATRAIAAKSYAVPSSIDGKLDVVNVHAKPRFSVFDDLHMREVRCHFPESMFEDVKRYLGKRVTVIGDVRFDVSTDRPISIRVDEIEPLGDDPVKPKLFSEMQKIDLTGDIPSEEYIRRLRDGGG